MGSTLLRIITVLIVLVNAIPPASAASNIDPLALGQKYGWTENGGWINLQGDVTNGVMVGAAFLEGFAWHENFGWINFGDGSPNGAQYSNTTVDDFGVNIDPAGNLSGYGWGENIGWIAFDTTSSGGARVNVDNASGRFSGYAWGENIGWLAFETVDPAHVATAPGYSRVRNWNYFD